MAGWGGGVGHRGFPAVQTDVAGRLHVFAQLLFALALALLLLPGDVFGGRCGRCDGGEEEQGK